METALGFPAITLAKGIHQLEDIALGADDAHLLHVQEADWTLEVDIGEQLGEFLRSDTRVLTDHFGEASRSIRFDPAAQFLRLGLDPARHFPAFGHIVNVNPGAGCRLRGPFQQPMVALEFFIFHQGNGCGRLGIIQQFEEFFSALGGIESREWVHQHHHPARRQEGCSIDGGIKRLEIQAGAPVKAGDVHVRGGWVAQPGA